MYGRPNSFRRSSERREADRQGTVELARLAKLDAERLRREDELEDLALGMSPASIAYVTVDEEIERERRREAAAEYEITGRVF